MQLIAGSSPTWPTVLELEIEIERKCTVSLVSVNDGSADMRHSITYHGADPQKPVRNEQGEVSIGFSGN